MEYNISVLNKDSYALVERLAEGVNLGEKIDLNCVFLAARNGSDDLAAVAGVRLGGKYPRFEHIIIDKPYQKTRLAVLLMKAMEKFLKPFGCYVSYILDTNDKMKNYALRWGMKPYNKDAKGRWYYKEI